MNLEEMLQEIVKYKYKCCGFPYVFLDYNQRFEYWSVTWRNPTEFNNGNGEFNDLPQTNAKGLTPIEACRKALEFINNNPLIFKK